MADALICVEVAYAKPDRQSVISLTLPIDSIAEQDLSQQKIGIFGQVCKLDKPLNDGDRVEIYRPLQQNPMDARRGRLLK
jgi:putative ubiquitin-RnfH superfamily antitoxin RatB of RatAB toxin-antitoxin module